jgi:GWxTD domain-containing protein
MRNSVFAFLFLLALGVHGQALRDINYNFLYDPDSKVAFDIKPVKLADEWKVLYQLTVPDTASLKDMSIEWYGYESINSKEGISLKEINEEQKQRNVNGLTGYISLDLSDAPKVIVARVIDKTLKQAYLFFKSLDEDYPVNNYLVIGGSTVTKQFVATGSTALLGDSSRSWIVSYYGQQFPPAAPAFSESQSRVAKAMKADSVFTLSGRDPITFFKNGLYLFQKDTLSLQGFSVRAADDYPRYNKIQNLAGPFIYICTKLEYDKLEMAKGDKKTFDRTVLDITNDQSRARQLIRNYFRRIELANEYFTSYKEGWKTDRGMIFIIYGLPDHVYKFVDREVWEYDSGSFNATFSFTKSTSVFDPDNYVLIRDKKFQTSWYSVIELWRNVRL